MTSHEERMLARLSSLGQCRCEPVTVGIVGAAGLGLVGNLMEGQAEVGAAKFGLAQARQLARYHQGIEGLNSELARRGVAVTERAAEDAEIRGGIEANRARAEGRQIIGAQRAAFGASGVDVGTGSPVAVAADTRAMSELDAQTIRNNAAREAWGYRVQGADIAARDVLARAEGRLERHQMMTQAELNLQRARNRRAGGILGGLASFGATTFGAIRGR